MLNEYGMLKCTREDKLQILTIIISMSTLCNILKYVTIQARCQKMSKTVICEKLVFHVS